VPRSSFGFAMAALDARSPSWTGSGAERLPPIVGRQLSYPDRPRARDLRSTPSCRSAASASDAPGGA